LNNIWHHLTDTYDGIKSGVKLLIIGAPGLVYINYNFENRPFWFRIIWKMTEFFRNIIIRLPKRFKDFVTYFSSFFLLIFPFLIFVYFLKNLELR
jgi:hypothetical protein